MKIPTTDHSVADVNLVEISRLLAQIRESGAFPRRITFEVIPDARPVPPASSPGPGATRVSSFPENVGNAYCEVTGLLIPGDSSVNLEAQRRMGAAIRWSQETTGSHPKLAFINGSLLGYYLGSRESVKQFRTVHHRDCLGISQANRCHCEPVFLFRAASRTWSIASDGSLTHFVEPLPTVDKITFGPSEPEDQSWHDEDLVRTAAGLWRMKAAGSYAIFGDTATFDER